MMKLNLDSAKLSHSEPLFLRLSLLLFASAPCQKLIYPKRS